jgi:ketosteroid isomerase-like protein
VQPSRSSGPSTPLARLPHRTARRRLTAKEIAMDLLEIGTKIQKAYASSIAEGHASMNDYRADHISVIHVPAVKADGTSSGDKMGRRAEAEVAALKGLNAKLTVEAVQQAGDDTLILETALSGTLPNGQDFRFPEVMIYTFEDGKMVRLIAVGSTEMFSTLAPIMKELGYASDDWAE